MKKWGYGGWKKFRVKVKLDAEGMDVFGKLFGCTELGDALVGHGLKVSGEGFELIENLSKDLYITFGSARCVAMWLIRSNPSTQFQELGGGVLVGRCWRTKGELTEVLQNVIELIKALRRPIPETAWMDWI